MDFGKSMGAPPDDKHQNDLPRPNDEAFSPSGQGPVPDGNFDAVPGGRKTAARLRAEADEAMAKMAALSPREREVIDCIAQGLSVKEIATQLSVSPKSVETYRARLIEKLDAKSPAALMRIAVLVSLMEPPRETPSD